MSSLSSARVKAKTQSARYSSRWYSKVPFPSPPSSIRGLETDKRGLQPWLREHGVEALSVREWELGNAESDDTIPMPVVVKPRFNSGGSIGVRIVTNSSDLELAVEKAGGPSRVVVQEALSGPVVWIAHFAARRGKLVGASYRMYVFSSSDHGINSGATLKNKGTRSFSMAYSRCNAQALTSSNELRWHWLHELQGTSRTTSWDYRLQCSCWWFRCF